MNLEKETNPIMYAESGQQIYILKYKTKKRNSKKVLLHYHIQISHSDKSAISDAPLLYQNQTDDSNKFVVIKFYLPHSAPIKLILMDSEKNEVISFVDRIFEAGNHTIITDLKNEELRIFKYYYKLKIDEYSEVRKMQYKETLVSQRN